LALDHRIYSPGAEIPEKVVNTDRSFPTIRQIFSRYLTPPVVEPSSRISTGSFEQIIDELGTLGVLLVDRELRCVYASKGLQQLFSMNRNRFVGREWLSAFHHDDADLLRNGFTAAVQLNREQHSECRLQSVDALPTWVSWQARSIYNDNGKFIGCLGTFTDITNLRKTSASLVHLSLYDSLTQLPNRTLLMQRLQKALALQANQPNKLALIFVDLDGFKLINDTLGHTMGNKLILEISQRIGDCLSHTDTLARLGSDEFTAIIDCSEDPGRAATVASNIMTSIKKPVVMHSETLYVTASAGIALSKNGSTADSLLREADVAMDNAKKANSSTAKYYDPRLAADNRAKLTVGCQLHAALERGEFSVFYQPQIDIRSNTIIGSEALLRWHSPELGNISPGVFVPLLEARSLIVQVGEWVLSQACHTQARWHREFPDSPTSVSVNVSSIQLHDRHFLTKLKRALSESELAPEFLILELTESILLDDYVAECSLLHEIGNLGVKIALDDFGTGYGSFSYLKKHPIDHIKIDRSFVENLFACEENKAITTSIIDLSHKLGKTVIAEGVDDQEELDFLMLHGCDIYQGFLKSRAIPADHFSKRFLSTEKKKVPTAA